MVFLNVSSVIYRILNKSTVYLILWSLGTLIGISPPLRMIFAQSSYIFGRYFGKVPFTLVSFSGYPVSRAKTPNAQRTLYLLTTSFLLSLLSHSPFLSSAPKNPLQLHNHHWPPPGGPDSCHLIQQIKKLNQARLHQKPILGPRKHVPKSQREHNLEGEEIE